MNIETKNLETYEKEAEEGIPHKGVYEGIPEHYYRSHKFIAQSDFKHRTGLHFKHAKENPKEPTESMKTGSALHCIVLEPESYLKRYAVLPEGLDRRTKAGKQIYEDFLATTQGKTILKYDQALKVEAMAKQINDHPSCAKIIKEDGLSEVSVFAPSDDDEGMGFKCRLDHITHSGIVLDVKTTEDASFDKFRKTIANYGYHIQGSYYLDCLRKVGVPVENFCIIAVEKEPPYPVALYELNHATLEKGRHEFVELMAEIYNQVKTDNFTGYSNEIIEMDLPSWAW